MVVFLYHMRPMEFLRCTRRTEMDGFPTDDEMQEAMQNAFQSTLDKGHKEVIEQQFSMFAAGVNWAFGYVVDMNKAEQEAVGRRGNVFTLVPKP